MMNSQRDEIASRLILWLRSTEFEGSFCEGDTVTVSTSLLAHVFDRNAGFSVDESLARDALSRLAEVDLVQVSPSKKIPNAFDVVATENGRRFVTNLDDSRVALQVDLRSRTKALWSEQGGASHDRARAEAIASFERRHIEIETLRNLLGSFQPETLMSKPQVSGSTLNMFLASTEESQPNHKLMNDYSWISWDCLGVRKQLSDCVRAIRQEAADSTRKGRSKPGARDFMNDNLVVAMSHMFTVYMANCCLAVESSKMPKKYFVLPCRLHAEAIVKLMGVHD